MKSIAFVLILALSRWLPLPPNFSPALALVLFAGATLRPRWMAFALPLLGILLSDMAIGFYSGMMSVYVAYVAVVALGLWIQPEWPRPGRLIAASFAGAVTFFFISNFGVWLEGQLYPRTAMGLWTSFVAGLPFFERSLLSTLLFTFIIFKIADFVRQHSMKLAIQPNKRS